MPTKTLTVILNALLLGSAAHAQMQRIVVQGSGAPQVFTEVSTAIAAAQNGDKLYFSGGTHLSPTSIIIDKELHLIGAGIHPDSTSTTSTTTLSTLSGSIHITTPASGSTFTGLVFSPAASDMQIGTSPADDDATGLLFERCRWVKNMVLSSGSQGGSSSTFNECIFDNVIVYGWNLGNGAEFDRCIFYSNGSWGIHNVAPLTVDHCVFLNSRVCRDSPGAIVGNSISTSANDGQFYQSGGSTITNCIFTNGDPTANSNAGGFVFTDNQVGVPLSPLFVSEVDGVFQFTDNLEMEVGSPGIGAADDGTDAGIHGSSTPYKLGAVPYNPHFRSATIAPATDANGDLPVSIRVAAQTH